LFFNQIKPAVMPLKITDGGAPMVPGAKPITKVEIIQLKDRYRANTGKIRSD
jgi:hypothetical protein